MVTRVTEKSHTFYYNDYEENFGFEKYFEHDVPVPVIEKIVYLRLGDTILELVHVPAGQANAGIIFA